MADAGEVNLYFSGGECPPYSLCPEDWFNCEKRGLGSSGLGSKPSYNFDISCNFEMFPSPDIGKTDNNSYTIACERGPATFSVSRHLDFNEVKEHQLRLSKGWNNQDSLRKWFLMHIEEIVPGFCLNVVHIPPKTILHDIVWCNNIPIEGLEFDLIEKFTGTVLEAGISGAEEGSNCITAPADLKWQHECNRILAIRLTAVPPINEDQCKPGCGSLDGWAVMVAALVCCPSTGK